jgi:hypothetical protein
MKTLLRTLLYLALIVWLGAEIFFPVIAVVTFNTLLPDTHAAGAIVGHLLGILHRIGLVSGIVILALLALAPSWGIYMPRAVLAPMVLVVLMMGCTAFSEWSIIPAMDRDRLAVGGTIVTSDQTNPLVQDFNRLHNRSVNLQILIQLLGIAAVTLVARAESTRA